MMGFALAVFVAALAGQSHVFSAAPAVAERDTVPTRTNVQWFNGVFVARVTAQAATPGARACLRQLANNSITISTYASGEIEISSAAAPCGAILSTSKTPSAPSTGTVSIAASRILAAALADDRFDSVARFRHNDRDLSRYDVEMYDSKGMINVTFLPLPTPGVRHTVVGCPETGPIAVTYIVNPTTFEVRGGNMVC